MSERRMLLWVKLGVAIPEHYDVGPDRWRIERLIEWQPDEYTHLFSRGGWVLVELVSQKPAVGLEQP